MINHETPEGVNMVIVAFTGSRQGLTLVQHTTMRRELGGIFNYCFAPLVGIHGDCVGADVAFHNACVELKIPVEVYPCFLYKQRSYCRGATITHPEDNPISRNRTMVNRANVLIACPSGPEVVRSGTWSTVRYAKNKIRVIVIDPLGEIHDHRQTHR